MAVQRKLKAIIDSVTFFNEDIKLFRLKPEKKLPRFKAGQFLHMAIDKYDPSYNWPESRVFSIANSPTRSNYIEILVSRKGDFTNRMFNELEPGSEVWIKLPYGVFNFEDALNRDVVLIAGGTGISPFISYLKWAITHQVKNNIFLFYGIRTPDLLIIDELINESTKKLQGFYYRIYCEKFNKQENFNYGFLKGKLSVNDIIIEISKIENSLFYLSGPPGMIREFKQVFTEKGVPKDNILTDDWGCL